MRLTLVVIACTALGLLGVRDALGGNLPTGAASVMLAVANAILLTR